MRGPARLAENVEERPQIRHPRASLSYAHPDRTAAEIPPVRTGASPGDPGAAHRNREGEIRHMATETARTEVPPDVSDHLDKEDRVGLLRAMLMMRGIEERAMTLYRQGKVPGSFYDGFGQEAVSA